MKLNYRDKLALLIVLLLIVWVIGIMFFIKPGIEDISSAKDERESLKVSLSDKKETIEKDKNLANEIQKSYDNANANTKCFYDYMVAQDASQLIDKYLDDKNITNLNMNVSDYSSRALTPYSFISKRVITSNDEQIKEYNDVESNATNDVNSTADSAASTSASTAAATTANNDITTIEQTVACYTISADYQGSYNDLKAFCDMLTTTTEKSLVITGLSMAFANADAENGDGEQDKKPYEVEGTLTFDMMMIRKLPALKK